ncbi:putative membrane protein [Parabacteroides sp. PF5-9]|nr:putative membrane protein [Parabacteroides sp. PF5-9]
MTKFALVKNKDILKRNLALIFAFTLMLLIWASCATPCGC